MVDVYILQEVQEVIDARKTTQFWSAPMAIETRSFS